MMTERPAERTDTVTALSATTSSTVSVTDESDGDDIPAYTRAELDEAIIETLRRVVAEIRGWGLDRCALEVRGAAEKLGLQIPDE